MVAVRLEDQRTATKPGVLRSLPSSVVASITGQSFNNGHVMDGFDAKRSSFNGGGGGGAGSSLSSTSASSISEDGSMMSSSSTSSSTTSSIAPPSFGAALSESLSMLLTFSFESNPAPAPVAPLTCLTLPSLQSVTSPSSSSSSPMDTPKKVKTTTTATSNGRGEVAYGSQIRLRSSEVEAGNDAFLVIIHSFFVSFPLVQMLIMLWLHVMIIIAGMVVTTVRLSSLSCRCSCVL
jgi:hypothetical protein